MAEDWAAAAADVDEGLREAGGFTVTLHQPGVGATYDPATDTTAGGSAPQDHAAYGIVGKAYNSFSISTGLVQADDIRLLVSPLKTNGEPLPEIVADAWTATWQGKDYAIKRVEGTKPTDQAVLLKLQLRA